MHKKWMVLCLLIGNILLISVASSYPMYRVSSFQRMLVDEFDAYGEEKGCWPAVFKVSHMNNAGRESIPYAEVAAEADRVADKLDVEMLNEVVTYGLSSQKAKPAVIRDNVREKRLTLNAMSGMEDHVEILYGKYPEDEFDSQGFIEVMVSGEVMVEQGILLEDEYTYANWVTQDGAPMKLKVVGVFRPLDENEVYWEALPDDTTTSVYTTQSLFEDTFLGEGVENQYSLNAKWSYIWDYEKLEISRVSGLMQTMNDLESVELLDGKIKDSGYMQILTEYSGKAKRVEATLLILQIPVLLLLCAFLYMIAGQMLQMERNEISMLRSRGASKYQVVLLYLMQSSFLSALSLVAGIPLGAVFCKLLGASTAFLEFGATRSLAIRFTPDVILYAIGAVILSVIVTTIPVISYSGLSIVKLKQSRSRQTKSLWKKMYLDVILLAISLYGYYSFCRSDQQMVQDVMTGKALDPLLYISFSLFALGAGLFCARIQPLLLKGTFALFRNHMKPSSYASVLGTIRTGAKQEFIILFMILTVSIGISDTTIARTIVLNAINNTRHSIGAELVVKEKWGTNLATLSKEDSLDKLVYYEPDLNKYSAIPGMEQMTTVVVEEKGRIYGKTNLDTKILGIKPQGFYQVTKMEEGLLPFSYEEYLNVMSAEMQAVLVSENYMTQLGYKLGDNITFENADGKRAMGKIYGFFNYWPTYEPTTYTIGKDGAVETVSQYMIVANQSFLKKEWGIYPYEVWMDVNDGAEGFYSWMEEQTDLSLTKLEDMTQKEADIVQDTMFQGTNGILSMSFIVILMLCCVGYLIYWIMSIRSRELLFGVLRAMGMRKREITWMLIIEQICSGLYAIVMGGGIGILASQMFVPMIQQAYAASEQILPLQLITRSGDIVQLFAIVGVMVCVCLLVLGRIVSKMNISSALKLGED